MEDERDSANVLRSVRSDPSGSRGGFKLSEKLTARMKKLEEWRILPSSIKSPEDACQFHGGHATVSKAFLRDKVDDIDRRGIWFSFYNWSKSYKPREYMQLCRQSSESNDHIRGAAYRRRGAKRGRGDKEKDDEEEHGSDSGKHWYGKFVAVKKSRMGDDKDTERVLGLALRETEFLVELGHPNVVKLEGFVEDLSQDIIWLVFPWAGNGNLKDFVASRDWEIPERISLINDVASGLAYLHSQKPPICHGDLKSFNVLVNSERCAVITDFGSARRLTEHDLNRQPVRVQTQQQPVQAKFSTISKTITLTGNIYTLRWAAPELLYDVQMSLWSDIWALGWIAYEVLTNSIPFQNVPADALVVEHVINGDLPSIHEDARVSLFQNLCSLMTMCWNSNPSERPTAEDYLHTISDMPRVTPDGQGFSSPSEALMRRGWKGRESGDSVMAFACFKEAYRIYTRTDDTQGRASALWGLAEVHRLQNEYSQAIAYYSEILQITSSIDNRQALYDDEAIVVFEERQHRAEIANMQHRASALWGLAEVHRLQNEYSQAIAYYSEILQITSDIDGRIALYDNGAIAVSKELQFRAEIANKQRRASALWGLAEVHRLRNEYSQAIAYYSEILQIIPDIDDRQALYDDRAIVVVEERQPRAEIANKQRRASALWGLAEAHRLRNEYIEAIPLYYEVLQIYTGIGERQGRADALWGLAEVHRVRNEYSEAIAHYSEILQISTDIDNKRDRASALWGLAEVHRLRNEYSQAAALYSEALQIYTGIGDKQGGASALGGLAEVHRLRGEYSEAIALYSEVLQICTDICDRKGRATALSSLAEVHRAQNEYSKAFTLYYEALQIYTDIGDRNGRADVRSALAALRRR